MSTGCARDVGTRVSRRSRDRMMAARRLEVRRRLSRGGRVSNVELLDEQAYLRRRRVRRATSAAM
eukprot:2330406-Prymnesium_polylepis.3